MATSSRRVARAHIALALALGLGAIGCGTNVRTCKSGTVLLTIDGAVTAVVGTHTHVQTADERVLPKGTAYLTDVGMTGPHDSIIGVEIEAALGKFLTALPAKFETATGNPRLNAVIIEADDQTGRATDIERISYSADELKDLSDVGSVRSTV